MMRYFSFQARHFAGGMQGVADQLAAEMYGVPQPVYVTTGKVRAWTRWGARRWIAKRFRSRLIEIVDIRRSASE